MEISEDSGENGIVKYLQPTVETTADSAPLQLFIQLLSQYHYKSNGIKFNNIF